MLGLAYLGYQIVSKYAPEWPLRALLIDTAIQIIQFKDSLEILTHAPDRGALATSLPSWVPDRTC
jgi:hypothetical protein